MVSNKFIRDLASGPLRSVKSVPIYYVNGYKFHTRKYGANRATFNSRVCIKGTNYSKTSNDYFGIIEEILIVQYPGLPIKRTMLFKCDWFDPTSTGTRVHQRYNIVEVNQKKKLSLYEPFILAMHAVQVYFCNYPSHKREKIDWLVICKVKARQHIEVPEVPESHQEAFQNEMPGHLNMITIENIPTHLNDEGGDTVDLDDDEISTEEEILIESEESGQSSDSDDYEIDSYE